MSTGFNWTTSYAYDAQPLCAYETVNDGFSKFCDLFTYEEWLYFEQAIDLEFAGMQLCKSIVLIETIPNRITIHNRNVWFPVTHWQSRWCWLRRRSSCQDKSSLNNYRNWIR